MIPFIYFHENHLPLLVIILLILVALPVGLGIAFLSILFLKILFQKEGVNFLYEALFLIGGLIIVFFLGLLDNRAGVLFLIIASIIYGFFRFFQMVLFYRILLFGFIILLNGLLTFKTLQGVELALFSMTTQNKYDVEGPNPELWKIDEESSIVTHETLNLRFKLPEGFFFHNPKDLKFTDKSGAGKFMGVVSSSLKDPNTYPLFRIFYLPVH
ncbi:MAG: hypothetical protein KDK36_22280, partial [Leptospiraceae bacterium]|nr:hypothetical protein [Leptospiraceae bacterium]